MARGLFCSSDIILIHQQPFWGNVYGFCGVVWHLPVSLSRLPTGALKWWALLFEQRLTTLLWAVNNRAFKNSCSQYFCILKIHVPKKNCLRKKKHCYLVPRILSDKAGMHDFNWKNHKIKRNWNKLQKAKVHLSHSWWKFRAILKALVIFWRCVFWGIYLHVISSLERKQDQINIQPILIKNHPWVEVNVIAEILWKYDFDVIFEVTLKFKYSSSAVTKSVGA